MLGFIVPLGALVAFLLIGKFYGNKRSVTREGMARTSQFWANREFVEIRKTEDVIAALRSAAHRKGKWQPPEEQVGQLWVAVSNLVEAYATGNYAAFLKHQRPVDDYDEAAPHWFPERLEAWVEERPGSPTPGSPQELYEFEWKALVSNSFWLELAPSSTVIEYSQLKHIPSDYFQFDRSNVPRNAEAAYRHEPPVFSYETRIHNLLTNHGRLHFARVNLIAKPRPPDLPRPFLICYVWDPESFVWLPWSLSQGWAPSGSGTNEWIQPIF